MTKTVFCGIRLKPETHKKLKDLAKERRETIGETLEWLLDRAEEGKYPLIKKYGEEECPYGDENYPMDPKESIKWEVEKHSKKMTKKLEDEWRASIEELNRKYKEFLAQDEEKTKKPPSPPKSFPKYVSPKGRTKK